MRKPLNILLSVIAAPIRAHIEHMENLPGHLALLKISYFSSQSNVTNLFHRTFFR